MQCPEKDRAKRGHSCAGGAWAAGRTTAASRQSLALFSTAEAPLALCGPPRVCCQALPWAVSWAAGELHACRCPRDLVGCGGGCPEPVLTWSGSGRLSPISGTQIPHQSNYFSRWCIGFLVAAITNHYSLGLKQQKCILTQFWRPEI